MKIPRRAAPLLALLGVFLAVIAGGQVAQGQETTDISFTGNIFDSFGAKIKATAVLAFDPTFAYGERIVLESAPAATAHAFIAFPGIVAAGTLAGDPNYPRFGGRLPSETACADPGLAKFSEPEVRNPRNYAPYIEVGPNRITNPNPPAPYNTNCEPGPDPRQCDVIRRGNPISGSDQDLPNRSAIPVGAHFAFASGYGRSDCDAGKLFAQTDQRAQNVTVLPPTPPLPAGASAAGSPLPGGLSPSLPIGTSSSDVVVAQQQPSPYSISFGSIRNLSRTELRGPGLSGAPPPAALDEPQPIAATGSFTGWLMMLGLLALGASAAVWAAARRLGRSRGLAAVGAVLILGANLAGIPSARAQEVRRIIATVDARVNDVVISAAGVELLRISEVRVLAVTEANGKAKGAKATVSRTVRGVKVLGKDEGDASIEKINEDLAPTRLSIQLGPVTSNASDDGTAASVDATGLIIEQKVVVPGVGGVQTPEYQLTLGRATPSVSFFSFSFGGLDGEIPVDGGGIPGDLPGDTFGQPPYSETAGGQPPVLSAPGVTRAANGKLFVEGKLAGFNFSGMSVKLWPLKDIAEAAGGILLLAGLMLTIRHRRRFA